MRKTTLLALLTLFVAGIPASAKEFRLYYLGGQSNMDGYGKVAELPADLKAGKGYEGVYIFHGNMGLDGQKPDGRGAWMPLKPGHGRNFKSDGSKHTYSDRFGLELTLAHTLKKHHPDAHIAFIKYSRGGTAIDSKAEAQKRFGAWDPEWNGGKGEGKGINQYDHFRPPCGMPLPTRTWIMTERRTPSFPPGSSGCREKVTQAPRKWPVATRPI